MEILLDELSPKSVFLTLMWNDKVLGSATGFIIKSQSDFYLVTNWHVLSGRNPYNRQPRHATGAIPNLVEISFVFANLQRAGKQIVPLDDGNGRSLWLEHAKGPAIDVALLKLTEPRLSKANHLEVHALATVNLRTEVGKTVFIIGYPFGKGTTSDDIHPNYSFPVWKTGHIASEPAMPYLGKPAVLIDATTRDGMSGSPVYIRTDGPYRNNDTPSALVIGPAVTKFLGVYSGRLNIQTGDDAKISSELGLVWNPSVIDEILTRN